MRLIFCRRFWRRSPILVSKVASAYCLRSSEFWFFDQRYFQSSRLRGQSRMYPFWSVVGLSDWTENPVDGMFSPM